VTYANIDDVRARTPYRDIGASTKPSTAEVEEWIGDAEAMLDAALAAIGLTVPLTADRAVRIAKAWVLDYAAGHFRASQAQAGGDGTNRDGQDLIEKFERLVGPGGEIVRNPDRFSNYLTDSSATDGGALRSYATSNPSDRTTEAVFKRGEPF